MQHSNSGESGCLTKSKGWGEPAGYSRVWAKGKVTQLTREPHPLTNLNLPFAITVGSHGILCRNCRETKVRLGRINSG